MSNRFVHDDSAHTCSVNPAMWDSFQVVHLAEQARSRSVPTLR